MQDIFSTNERLVLKIIGRRKMTIAAVADFFYDSCSLKGDELERKNYIAGVVRRIVRKCELNNSPWTLVGKGGGRTGRTVWRQKRKK
jgi:hypothetical protein